jgi:hypothetical protein
LSKTTPMAKEAGANGTRSKAARGGKLDGSATEAVPVATKADPLADVSFFDLDAELVAAKNGSAGANGAASEDAISRVRRRRVASAYAQRNST